MIRNVGRRGLLCAALGLVASVGLAHGQGAPPLDEWEPEQPDFESARKDGFQVVELSERKSDTRTPTIRERFVVPIEKAAGQDGSHDFEWALEDLNGDGYSDVVIVPRAPGLGLGERYDGIRILVFTFDGKEWHKALDGGGLAVARRTVKGPDGGDRHEIALIQSRQRILFRWDGKRFAEVLP